MANRDVLTEIAEKAELLRDMAEQTNLDHLAFILQCCVNTARMGEDAMMDSILAELGNATTYDA